MNGPDAGNPRDTYWNDLVVEALPAHFDGYDSSFHRRDPMNFQDPILPSDRKRIREFQSNKSSSYSSHYPHFSSISTPQESGENQIGSIPDHLSLQEYPQSYEYLGDGGREKSIKSKFIDFFSVQEGHPATRENHSKACCEFEMGSPQKHKIIKLCDLISQLQGFVLF
ncbi:hypothetical protein PCANC_01815 [Puccinia coronata f. sp. avenae]|nr:hypothetical protein PCANC_01815 [Puccinia coronata f. sp. avenae]